jgi:hypothetical protein
VRDDDDHAVHVSLWGIVDMNTEGCADRVADPDAPAQPSTTATQPARSCERADRTGMTRKAQARQTMNSSTSRNRDAGTVGAQGGRRPGSGRPGFDRSGSDHDGEATRIAFQQVIDACPADQRPRLTRIELDPPDVTIFMAEIVALHRDFAPFASFEWSILHDIGMCAAVAAREQRVVTALIQEKKRSVLAGQLKQHLKGRSDAEISALVEGYCAVDRKAVDLVDAALDRAGLGPSVITALARKAHEVSILDLERSIERMGNRRMRMLRELKADRSSRGHESEPGSSPSPQDARSSRSADAERTHGR